jgi:hypothetical protein
MHARALDLACVADTMVSNFADFLVRMIRFLFLCPTENLVL